MSLWVSLEGTLSVKASEEFSPTRSFDAVVGMLADGASLTVVKKSFRDGIYYYVLSGRFCSDGLYAAKYIDSWLDTFPSNVRCDFCTEIRFMK
mgnify:CR=1 FL=1